MAYRIHEIFYTLQGEGCKAGTPAVFVRFSGCNLQCPWCDTDFASFSLFSAEQIVDEAVRLFPASQANERLVVLTGGEPALQTDYTLVDMLHQAGFTVAIETNGTHTLPSNIDWITCSPKQGSHIALTRADEVKVVFTGKDDIEHWYADISAAHYLLQPLHNGTSANVHDTIRYILSHPHWHLSLQQHKLCGFR